ncbi:MAG: response regulator, partial [Zoogloeaceae bacterium]|nr:response regulator [Zoogloeaceae bacterium]
ILHKVVEVVSSGLLGQIVGVMGSAVFYKPDSDGYYDGPNAWRREPGGGPILLNLIHEVGNLRAMVGEIVAVQSFTSNATRGFNVEDTAAINFQFANGALGSFLLSDAAASPRSWEQTSQENKQYPTYPDEDCYTILGNRGSLAVPTMRLKYYKQDGDRSWYNPFRCETLYVERKDPLAEQIAHFAAVIRGEAEPLVSARDGLQNLRVTEAESGQKALEIGMEALRVGTPFHVALLDWQMPDMDGIETARRLRETLRDYCPTIVMITAYGREEVLHLAARAGIHNVLIKPVNASLLFDEMTRILANPDTGNVTAAEDAAVERTGSVGSTLGAGLEAIAGARILLVEDNDLNQQVACEILQDAQFQVDVAGDGAAALEWVRRASQPYDMIFMDVQMPVMDGMEATRQLRAMGHVLPIVAMTANAMPGDRERCLEAGMNDHLPKPIEPEQLRVMLLRWIRPDAARAQRVAQEKRHAAEKDAPPQVTLPHLPGLNLEDGLRRVLGKARLYRDLLEKFLMNQAETLSALRAALAKDDRTQLARLAHTLRGVAGNIGATEISACAARLESICRAMQGAERSGREHLTLKDCLAELEGALSPFMTELRRFFLEHAAADAEAVAAAVQTDARSPHVAALLKRLADLLAESDAEALDVLETESATLQAVFGAEFTAFAKSLQTFDFDEAYRKLARHLSPEHKNANLS